MKNQTQKTPGRVFLSKSKNRPYLPSCPVRIVHAEFYLDLKIQKKVMKLCIRNDGDRAVTALTIYAQYLDKDSRIIGLADGHIVLKFTDIYCAPHQTTLGSKTVILPYQDIAGIDACIGYIAYENGESDEFSPEDYQRSPVQDMLENRLPQSSFSLLQSRFGRQCVFVPMAMPEEEHSWLCTCGAVSEGDVCTVCGMKQRDAMQLCEPEKATSFLRRLRLRRAAIRSLPYASLSLALVLGITLLGRGIHHYIHETLPADRLAVTEKFMKEHRYEEALGYSTVKNGGQMYDTILRDAVLYFCETGEYARALEFEQCRETPDYESIYSHAAAAYLESGSNTALSAALAGSPSSLRDQVLQKLAENARGSGNLADACAIALHMTETDSIPYADSLLYEMITALLAEGQYEDAVSYISYLHDTSGIVSVCNGIEKELLARGRYDDAFSVAEITGDTSVFAAAYSTATESTLRRYYDKFYPHMNQEDRRAFLATEIAADQDSLTVIREQVAQNSDLGVLNENAVSTAAGDDHTLVLTRDGVVYAYGSNTYGQCACNGVQNVLAIAAGGNHSVLLMDDGTVRVFGDNACGQANVSAWTQVIAIAAGKRHTAALLQDGTVVACGSNDSGQCDVQTYQNVVGIAGGEYSTLLIFRTGNVIAQGNLTLETLETRTWKNVIRVSAGNSHLVALCSNGRVLTAGNPPYSGFEDDTAGGWSRIRAIACGERAVYALNASEKILFCGSEIPDLTASGWESLLQ